jgi:hypothetical protein
MEVGMMLEPLAPGVQDGDEADLGAEVPGIPPQRLERFRGGAKEQAVDEAFVLQSQRAERIRKREDDVEVGDVQQLLPAGIEPLGPGRGLALRAMAVATRVVGDPLVVTPIAAQLVSTESASPADRDVAQNPPLLDRDRMSMTSQKRRARLPKDIGHLGPMPLHQLDPDS